MQILNEGDRLVAKKPFVVSDQSIAIWDEGVVEAIGPAWDQPIDITYIAVLFDNGKKIDLPLTRAVQLMRKLDVSPRT